MNTWLTRPIPPSGSWRRLACALCLCVVAACASDGVPATDTPAETATDTATDAPADTPAATDTGAAPVVDPGLAPPASRYDEPWRPQVHFSPAEGWLNDPNGLVWHEDRFHLFYQHNPAGALWGPMHWGHAVGPDLLRWEHRPVALAPDPTLGMAFSGSAVSVDAGDPGGLCAEGRCLVLVFTHAGGTAGGQKQSLAVSADGGETFALYPGDPVLTAASADFRDPKVFWHPERGRWVLVLAAGDRIELYTSADLVQWAPLAPFAPPNSLPDGSFWECPDLFPLADPADGTPRWVLAASRSRGIGAPSDAVYWTGRFDGDTFVADDLPEGGAGPRLLDAGPDFYAAQSWYGLPDGERVWVAWMSNWGYALGTPGDGWRGALTVPRRLSLVAGGEGGGVALAQRPVDALDTLRLGLLAAVDDAPLDGERLFPLGPGGVVMDVEATFAPGAAREVGLRVRVGDGEETVVGVAGGRLFLDRSTSGVPAAAGDFAGRWEAPLPAADDGLVTLRVVVDRSSVEVFAQGGRVALTALVFPAPGSTDLAAYADGGAATLVRLRAHALGTIWPASTGASAGD